MKKLLTIGFMLTTISLQAQFKTLRKVPAHTAVIAATGIHVEYFNSPKNELIIEAEKEEFLNQIETEVRNGKLEIRYKPNTTIKTKTPSKVLVYTNSTLVEAKANSSAILTLNDPIQTKTMLLEASSSGKLTTNNIKAATTKIVCSSSANLKTTIQTPKLWIVASSSAKVYASGNAESVVVKMSSSSSTNLEQLKINDLNIDGSSSAKLIFYTASTLNSALSSSAKAMYIKIPNQIIKNSTSSSGKLMQQ